MIDLKFARNFDSNYEHNFDIGVYGNFNPKL